MRFSMSRALQYAVYEYHRRGNDLAGAISHFEAAFRKNFKAQARLPILVDQLTQYDTEYRSLGNTCARWNQKIVIPITEGFQLGGEIGRLDLAADGRYAVWLLSGKSHGWQDELRIPLIQRHFAERMVVEPQMVDVGFYFFDLGEHESICFNADDLAAAAREALDLASALAV
jgi:hypothetical protein